MSCANVANKPYAAIQQVIIVLVCLLPTIATAFQIKLIKTFMFLHRLYLAKVMFLLII